MPTDFKPGCARPKSTLPKQEAAAPTEQFVPKEAKQMIKVGAPAPDFELAGYYQGSFKNFRLSEYAGKWVVLCFYPGDFTFVWATEVSAVADKINQFKEIDTEVMSISVDSIFVHKMWDDHELSKMVEGGISFPMLSDAGGGVGSLYGVYDPEAGVEMRGRFIIDPDGIIQGYEVLTPPVGRNVAETLRQLKAFQLVRAAKGTEATPSGWQPGKKTLKPGPELVGNVWQEWSVKDD